MKVGDTVQLAGDRQVFNPSSLSMVSWDRTGLVLGFSRGLVQVFWGEDFPCEDEYPDQLVVV